jgi:phosphomannomutase
MAALMLSVSGCRGVVGESLTPEVCARFAGAFGSFLRDRHKGARVRVVLGRDGRRGGEMVLHAATSGLLASGCDVIDLGVAMTPSVAVMTDHIARTTGAPTAGMVLTASHNPQQWNGLKCLLAEGGLHGSAACAPPAALAAQVIERFRAGAGVNVSWDRVGTVAFKGRATETHIARVIDAMHESGLSRSEQGVGRGVRVAVDCVNASASRTAPAMLHALGCEVVGVNCDAEGPNAGLFPHPPEPTRENLSGAGGLCDVVRSRGCAVGFALDPDADRLALIDENGEYVGEEYTLALSAWAILEAGGSGKGATLVTNLSTSRMLNDVAVRFGARVVRTPVGEANVVEAIKREGAIAGGEGNGGAIWPRSCYVRDSLSAMALVLWLMSPAAHADGRGRRLSELVTSLPSYAIVKRKVDLPDLGAAGPMLERVARAFGGQSIDRSDGVWVDVTSGALAGRAWVHIRASNTEPILRLIAEAPRRGEAEGLLEEASRAMVRA